MAILSVGPTSDFPSIKKAMAVAGPGDTIALETGYSQETATVTHSGMIVDGDADSSGIVLRLGAGVTLVTLTGDAPINVFDAAGEGNSIVGNDGDNVIHVSGGADTVSGGAGHDRLVVDYGAATGAITGDATSNFTEAGGGGRMVTIDGGFEDITVLTGSGADTITTGAGDDIIHTGEGAGTITAGQGFNQIVAGGGADTITALDGGNDIDSGDGENKVTTGDGADHIVTGTGADTIISGGGNDTVQVSGGADTLDAGAGDDRVIIDYSASTTAVTGGVVSGGAAGYEGHIADLAGATFDFVNAESFQITTGGGKDDITTGGGDDVVRTGGGRDQLHAGNGDDVLDGGRGGDTLFGQGGADRLNGGAGSDVLNGGKGADDLTGGSGADRFMFSALNDSAPGARHGDLIQDFGHGEQDRIDLTGIDADATQAGDQAFHLVGGGFSGHAGELMQAGDGHGGSILSGDVNGDGLADFEIRVAGGYSFVDSDFML